MKLHFFILLFVTCSLLFHAPLPEIEMDPEPEQTKKEKSKRQRR